MILSKKCFYSSYSFLGNKYNDRHTLTLSYEACLFCASVRGHLAKATVASWLQISISLSCNDLPLCQIWCSDRKMHKRFKYRTSPILYRCFVFSNTRAIRKIVLTKENGLKNAENNNILMIFSFATKEKMDNFKP